MKTYLVADVDIEAVRNRSIWERFCLFVLSLVSISFHLSISLPWLFSAMIYIKAGRFVLYGWETYLDSDIAYLWMTAWALGHVAFVALIGLASGIGIFRAIWWMLFRADEL